MAESSPCGCILWRWPPRHDFRITDHSCFIETSKSEVIETFPYDAMLLPYWSKTIPVSHVNNITGFCLSDYSYTDEHIFRLHPLLCPKSNKTHTHTTTTTTKKSQKKKNNKAKRKTRERIEFLFQFLILYTLMIYVFMVYIFLHTLSFIHVLWNCKRVSLVRIRMSYLKKSRSGSGISIWAFILIF